MPQVSSFNVLSSDVKLPSLSCFEVLRVLALEGDTSSEHDTTCLEHLGKLVHLRHLKLGRIGISELPKEIGYLKLLVVLDLGRNSISELPESIGRLSQLKCLNICETDIEVPNWIGNLTSLEELCLRGVDVDSNFVTELGKLIELRKLRISNTLELLSDSARSAWAESIAKLNKIQVIDINLIGSFRVPGDESPWKRYALSPQLRVLHMAYG